MTERGMRGCSVIVNRLIDNVFWLSCKDERKKRNDQLSEGDSIFPYIKNMPSFLKKMVMFLRNITPSFWKIIKVFLQHGKCAKLKPTYPIVSCRGEVRSPEKQFALCLRAGEPCPYERNDSIIHILTHPLFVKCVRTHRATHTVA